MRGFVGIIAAIALWFALAFGAAAQDDDKGFLTRAIQDALSGSGRTVDIVGFQGALSSTASFDRMTIADKDGVWLTLNGAELVWNRSALLRGRLEVESLTAASLDIPRLPVSEPSLPDAEAAPFALPDLPVSILIEAFGVEQISLGAPLLGESAQLSVTARAQYTEDVFDVDVQAQRTDGKAGSFALAANYERSDTILDLLLKLNEGPEGIVGRLLNLPGQPAVDMSVQGTGPLDDFSSDVVVSTDGQERLAGQITLGTQTPRRASDTPDRRVLADIGGDITALLAPRYREFFGDDVRLNVDALIEGSGAIELSAFTLKTEAADLSGKVALGADKWPTFIDIKGLIANPDGTAIQLPLSGDATTVERVRLVIDYDASNGDALNAAFNIAALSTKDVSIAATILKLGGTLQGSGGGIGQFNGDLAFDADGLAFTAQPVAEAVGQRISGNTQITHVEGQPLEITDLSLTGADYALRGDVVIESLETGFTTLIDAVLEASDISRFSALAGRELDGQTRLALKGSVTPLSGQFDLRAEGSTQDLKLGIEQADAVLAGRTQLSLTARRDETGTFLRDLILENNAIQMTAEAQLRTDDSRAVVSAKLADIGLVLPQYEGAVEVDAVATQDTRGWSIDATTSGPYGAALSAKGLATGPDAALNFTADLPDVEPFAEGITGPVKARGTLRQTPEGWQIDTDASGPYQVQAAVNGMLTPALDLSFEASVPNVQPLVPQLNGPLDARGTVQQTERGFVIDTVARGPYGAQAKVAGLATGPDMSLSFEVAVPDLRPLAPQLDGPLDARGTVRQTPDGILVDTTAAGPYGAKAEVAGLATGPNMRLNFNVSMPNVRPLAPGISGPLSASGMVRQTSAGIMVQTTAQGPYSSRGSVDGIVTGPDAAVDFNLSMPNIGSIVEKVNGPLDVTGSARKQGTAWRVTTDADGPAGTQARVSGLVNTDGTLNLDINGNAPLGLSRPFLAPRNLQGQAQFGLSINGPAALSSVTGTVQTSNATLSAPNLRVALENIAATIRLSDSRANVDLQADAVNGGQLRVGGDVTLTASLPADLQIALNDLVLIDPRLYRSSVSGALRLSGPLLGGGGQISGDVSVGETVVNVPSTGLTTFGEIPQITHIGDSSAAAATRRKAGLSGDDAGADPAANAGAGFGLNLSIAAPRQIFVRGRGLDAELGGALRLTGTTRRVISAGQFELLRGRLDILGKRFDLVEGAIQFQGDLIPYLRFVSSTTTQTGEVNVVVEGPADAPEVSFTSNPEAPQDEVLAQLLFGRNLSDISAFQALQLANAVATLAGRGGTGIISNLRDNFGLDDLDVTTTDSGATAVRVGKYLTDNVYTDVTAASDGTGEVSLNIDISPNLTGKATLGSDGNSGIGLFFEKDY